MPCGSPGLYTFGPTVAGGTVAGSFALGGSLGNAARCSTSSPDAVRDSTTASSYMHVGLFVSRFATWIAGATTGSRVARCNAHAAARNRSVRPPATSVIAPAHPR